MPLVNDTLRNFVGGELSLSVSARSDIKAYEHGCERLENFILETTGPIKYRTGTKFVNATRRNQVARFIPFQFSDSQCYLIEMTPGYFRFYKDGGVICMDNQSITGIIAANPTVITSPMHGLNNGDEVFIYSMSGEMSVLNGRSFIVKNATLDTFALYDDNNNPIDTTGLTFEGNILDGGNATTNPPDVYNGGNASNSDDLDVDLDTVYTGGTASVSPADILDGGNATTNPSYNHDGGNADNTNSISIIDGSDAAGTGLVVGVLNKIYEITNPYTNISGKSDDEILDYLNEVYYTQNTDTMYFVHPDYPPRKLTRTSHTSWQFSTFSRTNDYMTGPGKYPGAVAFDGAGRIVYSAFKDEPDLVLMSRGPDSTTGQPRYDDFTTGTLANDAIKMYLASTDGKVMVVKWLAVNNKYFLVGTESGLLRLVSSDGSDYAFSAEKLPVAKSVDSVGCENIKPVPKGTSMFYMQKGSRILRCLEYDLYYDSYKSADENLVADTITLSGVRELVFQLGRPDILWMPKVNGDLIGMTYHESENVSGWHRTFLGGSNAKVLSCGIMPRTREFDQLWVIVERVIGNSIKRYVEYFADFEHFLTKEDFYTKEGNEKEDLERYYNDMFERQKNEIHLDSCLTYDGSLLGLSANASLIISPILGSDGLAVITSNIAVFHESDVDRQIWRLHENGIGSGRAAIVEFVDYRNVICKIKKAFDVDILPPGYWSLTTAKVSGLNHLEGETVNVVADGAVHTDCVVNNGEITLNAQADIIHVGYKYRGLVKSMNLNFGGQTGSAQNKARNVFKVIFEFLNSLGVKFGTNLYALSKLDFRTVNSHLNRPSQLFTGPKEKVFDDKTAKRKHVYVVQESPLPCTIQAIDVFMEVDDD